MNIEEGPSILGKKSADPGSGLYVDVENLQQGGETVIQELIESWPVSAPSPTHLGLFVQADQMELWQLWANSQFRNLTVSIFGTQHFSQSQTKNSADIAMATRSMADLLRERVSHIVILSNDSDFISLFAAIRDELRITGNSGVVPFTWVVIDQTSSLSPTVKRFFPQENLHVIPAQPSKSKTSKAQKPSSSRMPDEKLSVENSTWAQMALAVIRNIEIGTFKSTECQPIIKKQWANHSVAKAGGAAFGTEFKNNIWPLLQSHGVVIDNPGGKPVRYRMTAKAKEVTE